MKLHLMVKYVVLPALFYLSSCAENDEAPRSGGYFMSAKIDGMEWKVQGLDQARFSAEYVDIKDRFLINIHADDSNDQPDQSKRKTISFQFDFAPHTGRYYFNNDASTNLELGVIAICTTWDRNRIAPTWSTEGYIDIQSISKNAVSGTFTFKASGDVNMPAEIVVEDGKFNCIYGGGNIPWPGP